MKIEIKKFGKLLISRPAGKEAFAAAKAYVLKEVDDKGVEKVAGVDFKSFQARITDYQLVFTGNDASAGPIRADFVAAEGYTAPVIGDIVTSIKRDADTVGSSVTLSWMINKAGVTAVDIYSVSGTSESTTAVYTTDTTKWKAESTNVSATTYTDKAKEGLVGAGYQKYYKVFPVGTTLMVIGLFMYPWAIFATPSGMVAEKSKV